MRRHTEERGGGGKEREEGGLFKGMRRRGAKCSVYLEDMTCCIAAKYT